MSLPKRGRSPEGQQVSNEASPSQPRPRSAATAFDSASDTASDTPAVPNRRAFSSVVWSASMLADVLDDDGDDAPKKNKFLSPTIVSCLRVDGCGPNPEPFYLHTVIQSIAVWWPSTAAALWTGQQSGEGGHADALRAMIRIDSINGGDEGRFTADRSSPMPHRNYSSTSSAPATTGHSRRHFAIRWQ